MTTDDKIKYAIEHPGLGRTKLQKALGIDDTEARYIVKRRKEGGLDSKSEEVAIKRYLERKGLTVEDFESKFEVKKAVIHKNLRKINRKFRVGIIGDTHLCDKACDLDNLHDYYRVCREEGVEVVTHSGDLTAGIDVYRGQNADLEVYGFDDQLKYCILNYPQVEGIETHFINGNHDMAFKKVAGANFGENLALKRKDLIWLGDYASDLYLNGVKFKLQHGGGSATKIKSYKLQTYIGEMGGDQKPQIYSLGHFHTALYMFFRNIHCFMPACFQKPTDLSIQHGLPNLVAGWIVEIEVADDEHNSIM